MKFVRGPKLKRSNVEMASSSSAVSPASFDFLPDELALKILKMATCDGDKNEYDE